MKQKKTTGCHNCPYNGKHNNACLSCTIIQDEYAHPFQHYILPTYDAPQPEKAEPLKATDLEDDCEDYLRQKLYQIFDLDFSEIMLLKCIMNHKSLTEFAEEFNRFMEYNNNKKQPMTRFCAF